jgi:hypothetical protein
MALARGLEPRFVHVNSVPPSPGWLSQNKLANLVKILGVIGSRQSCKDQLRPGAIPIVGVQALNRTGFHRSQATVLTTVASWTNWSEQRRTGRPGFPARLYPHGGNLAN